MKHECPVNGCMVQCEQNILMCKTHWFMVNKSLRDMVWTAWRRVLQWPNDKGMRKTYLKIREDAIKDVNRQLAA